MEPEHEGIDNIEPFALMRLQQYAQFAAERILSAALSTCKHRGEQKLSTISVEDACQWFREFSFLFILLCLLFLHS